MLGRGALGSLGMICYYSAIYLLPLADAVTINLIRPPLAALFAWLVLSESFPWQGWLGLMVSLAGVAVVAHPPFLFGGHAGWGVARVAGIGIDVTSACCGAGECSVTEVQLATAVLLRCTPGCVHDVDSNHVT